MKTTKMSQLALVMGAVVMASGAMADTDTANLTVGAGVVNACSIGAGTLEFGESLSAVVSAGSGRLGAQPNINQSSSAISYVCTNGASATITANMGEHAFGAVRKMMSGRDLLTYELYTNSGRSVALGSEAGETGSIPVTANGTVQTTTIYGQILGADLARAKKGYYADTVALSINYTP